MICIASVTVVRVLTAKKEKTSKPMRGFCARIRKKIRD